MAGGKRRYQCPKCGSKAYTCLNAPWEYPRELSCRSCDTYFKSPSDEERQAIRERVAKRRAGEAIPGEVRNKKSSSFGFVITVKGKTREVLLEGLKEVLKEVKDKKKFEDAISLLDPEEGFGESLGVDGYDYFIKKVAE